jgi:hypothetical protein
MKRKKPKLDAEFWRQDAENRRRMAERVAEIEAQLKKEREQASQQPDAAAG